MTIRTSLLRAAVVGCLALASSSAFAAFAVPECAASVDFGVDGAGLADPVCAVLGEDGKSFSGNLGGGNEPYVFDLGDDGNVELSLSFLGNTDPFISYSFGVTNNSASVQTFTLVFSSAYVLGPYNTLTSSMSSSVTNRGPDSIVQSSVVMGESFISTAVLDGSDILAASVGAGCSLTGLSPLQSAACETTPVNSTAVASAANGTFGVRVRFTLSPRDLLSMNGIVSLDNVAVPAPGVLALLGLGLAGAGLLNRRRAA